MFTDKDEFEEYSYITMSDISAELLKDFSKSNPNIRKELINGVKNNMMNSMFKKDYNEDFAKGVVATLKYIARYF